MSFLQYLVFVGAFVQLISAIPYISSMLKGGAKPNRVSWLMWSAAPIIASVASVSAGVGWAALPVFMSGFVPLLILISSFAVKDAYWKLKTFDYVCGALSALALVFWAITKNPNVAIVFSIASDGLAAVPTILKSLVHPESESIYVYAAGLFNALTAFGAITTWTFSSYGFPIYLVIINTTLMSSILIGRYRRRLPQKRHV